MIDVPDVPGEYCRTPGSRVGNGGEDFVNREGLGADPRQADYSHLGNVTACAPPPPTTQGPRRANRVHKAPPTPRCPPSHVPRSLRPLSGDHSIAGLGAAHLGAAHLGAAHLGAAHHRAAHHRAAHHGAPSTGPCSHVPRRRRRARRTIAAAPMTATVAPAAPAAVIVASLPGSRRPATA